MILITEQDIQQYVTFAEVLAAIERAFVSLHQGTSSLFDVVRGHGGGANHFFAIKSARDGSIPMLGLKAGSYAPENNARGLPAHSSTTLLIDDRTGMPIAAVEAGYLNGLRTSAANALAVRTLARPDATTLGIIGVGAQAGRRWAIGTRHSRSSSSYLTSQSGTVNEIPAQARLVRGQGLQPR